MQLRFCGTLRCPEVNGQVMHPLIWNLTRFHPFWALIEMTMGIVAARHVMLDTEEDKKKPTTPLSSSQVRQTEAFHHAISFYFCLPPWPKEPAVALHGGLRFPGSALDQVRLQRGVLRYAQVGCRASSLGIRVTWGPAWAGPRGCDHSWIDLCPDLHEVPDADAQGCALCESGSCI